jgi:hypothetical protein
VPTVEFPPAVPLTDQVTVLSLSPVTVAVNCCTWPAATNAVAGETVTAAAEALIVTMAEADFVVSVLLVATTVAVVVCVTLGAVYLPVASMEPGVGLELLTVQVTPALDESFITVAVNCVVPPDATVAVAGVTVTEMVCVGGVSLLPPQPEMNEAIANTNESARHFDKSFRMMILSAG